MIAVIEKAIVARLEKAHGRGTAEQHDYFRCHGCKRIVTWAIIRQGGCACGMSNKVSPANLSTWEKARLILFPRWRLAQTFTAVQQVSVRGEGQ